MKQRALTVLAPLFLRTSIEEKRRVVGALGAVLDEFTAAAASAGTVPCARCAPSSPEPRPEHCAGLDGAPLEPQAGSQGSVFKEELRELFATHTLHYVSLFVLDAAGQGSSARVGLEVIADGSARAVRERLARSAPTFLRALFVGCEGLDPSAGSAALERWLARFTRRPNAFFAAFPGRSVEQIHAEQSLRMRVRDAFRILADRPPPAATGALHGCARVTQGRPRFAPSSASALWERLQGRFSPRDERLLRTGPSVPVAVRWNLVQHGFRDQANLWGARAFWALLVATAVAWWWSTPPPGEIVLRVAEAAFGGAALAHGVAWWREAPRKLNGRGAWHVVVAGVTSASWAGAVGFVALGAAGRVARLAQHMASGAPGAAGLALAVLGVAAVASALRRRGMRLEVTGALALAVTDLVEGASPGALHLALWALAATVAGLALVASFTALYVLDGAVVGLVVAGTLGFAWLALAVEGRLGQATLATVAVGGLVTVALIAFVRIVLWLWAVRRREQAENALAPRDPPSDRHLEEVEKREDLTLQNHLVTVSLVKGSALRLTSLRRVLRLVSIFAKVYATKGDLAGIRTIHFAQWLLLDDEATPRLVFLSNYDAAFNSYLQEFNGVPGVTAIWSHCVGFPPTFALLFDGAADDQRFKQFGRRDQIPTLGWYSAYPRLFIRDIEIATAIREDLRRKLDDPKTFVGQMRAVFGRPLSEAHCDAALQKL
jgi:hypothetical protein